MRTGTRATSRRFKAIAAGAFRDWAQRRKSRGEKSAAYQNRVLGNFAEAGTDVLIPLAWVEAAHDRWLNCNGRGRGKRRYGVDVARFGDDLTVIAGVVGNVVEALPLRAARHHALHRQGHPAHGVNGTRPCSGYLHRRGCGRPPARTRLSGRRRERRRSAKDEDGEEFTDLISSELPYNLRRTSGGCCASSLIPDSSRSCSAPPPDEDEDDHLLSDPTAPRWAPPAPGESRWKRRKTWKKRIGRSTDDADAVALALSPVTSNRRKSHRASLVIRRGIELCCSSTAFEAWQRLAPPCRAYGCRAYGAEGHRFHTHGTGSYAGAVSSNFNWQYRARWAASQLDDHTLARAYGVSATAYAHQLVAIPRPPCRWSWRDPIAEPISGTAQLLPHAGAAPDGADCRDIWGAHCSARTPMAGKDWAKAALNPQRACANRIRSTCACWI
ncbi:MAG: hypothetical protein U0703_27905 [Anaerolineae bacterium]